MDQDRTTGGTVVPFQGIASDDRARNGVPMCGPAICPTCGKVTYAGCGLHVEQVLADVPEDRRCTCPGPVSRPSR